MRANLRNAWKNGANSDWSNIGDVDVQNRHNPKPSEKTCGLAVTAHLWKKGYKMIKKIGEGSFSEVVKTQSMKDGKYYACKTMKQTVNSAEQANNLREVQAMRRLGPHANIIQLHDLIFDKENGTVSLICELMEMNIYEFIKGGCGCKSQKCHNKSFGPWNNVCLYLAARQTPLPDNTVKNYMYQLCKSLDHMHRCGIFHRDVKPENILIKHNVLKLGDFGSCRSVQSKPPHTEYISTRWYRAPECLLTDGYYSLKMDIWSVGCVFFEVMSLNPLFPGTNELDQIAKIHDVLGTPDQSVLRKFKQSRAMYFNFPAKKGSGISRLIPNCPTPALSLLYQMLAYDADERITTETALKHTYFRETRLAEKKTSGITSDLLWRPTRLGKQMRGRHMRPTPLISTKHLAEPLCRRNVSHYTTELPELNMSFSGPPRSFPASTSPAFALTHRGTLPAINSKKCQTRLVKAESQKASLKNFYMPPLGRKHGGGC
ncbi:MAPK/MAK/MRK overlapping kinase-like isoform X2 [Entelurus aequoreus]|uniref:MAPK/MAK/MRK overlapping kinase-like isoform X2 n=1 Tax=Entelurus aequoreus TaxID=161455 RepID=UPI002B1DFEC3|nr:MAPK/MAK/MRK overlapping kinase-like isoform X2 [Entelurus aequoreus]